MAKSLKCNDCGKLLQSVKEAQDHNDVTGHVNFEETTVAVSRCRLSCLDPLSICHGSAWHAQHTTAMESLDGHLYKVPH